MRWLFWLFTGTTCLAGYGAALPEVKVSTSGREVVVQSPPPNLKHLRGRIYLAGTIADVSAEVDRQPQQTRLSEVCTLRVESVFGYEDDDLQHVAGISTAVLKASYEQSPYVPVGDDLGRLWHLKKGQRLLVILHLCEEALCFDPEELVVLDERTAALTEVLRRTEFDLSRVMASDLDVLNAAGPLFHENAVRAAKALRRMKKEQATFLNKLVGVCVVSALMALLGADHYRRFRSPRSRGHSQNPTT